MDKKKKPRGVVKKTIHISKWELRKQLFTFTHWHLYLMVGLFTALLYTNTLNHGFVLDDDLVCARNSFVQAGFAGLADIFSSSWLEGFNSEKDGSYRPMVLAGFAVEKGLFGHSAKVYHAMNIFWYGMAMVVLILLLRKTFAERKPWIALAMVLLYAAHPLHVEVVCKY